MDGVFWLDGVVEHEPAIDAWFDARPPELSLIGRPWFAWMRDRGRDVRELLHDGCPVACVGDAPFAYVNIFTAHVNVGFFYGAELADPHRLLEGRGRRMRHVKLRPGSPVDATALRALIDAAYADLQSRLVSRHT